MKIINRGGCIVVDLDNINLYPTSTDGIKIDGIYEKLKLCRGKDIIFINVYNQMTFDEQGMYTFKPTYNYWGETMSFSGCIDKDKMVMIDIDANDRVKLIEYN